MWLHIYQNLTNVFQNQINLSDAQFSSAHLDTSLVAM